MISFLLFRLESALIDKRYRNIRAEIAHLKPIFAHFEKALVTARIHSLFNFLKLFHKESMFFLA